MANDLKDADCEELARELASRMDLDEPSTAKFVHECMTRAGYEAKPVYVKDETKDEKADRRSGDSERTGWFKNG